MHFTGKEFLTKHFTVNSFQSDLKGQLSLPSLFSLFQEMAWEHATLNGFGYDHLHKAGCFWVLSRIKIELSRLPRWTEEFSLTTWPSGVDGVFALRDFQLRGKNDEILAGAASSWLIVDIKNRRPQRLTSFKDKMPICETFRATKSNAQRLEIPFGEAKSPFIVTAGISDIDVNGHINNAKYIEWAVNAFPFDVYNDLTIGGLEVNFLSEGFCGDTFTVKMFNQPSCGFSFSIHREKDQKDLAILRIFKNI